MNTKSCSFICEAFLIKGETNCYIKLINCISTILIYLFIYLSIILVSHA